jgi:hypothetical protein
MKILLSFLIGITLCIAGQGQSFEPISYQTVVRNAEGQIVASKPVALKLSVVRGNPFDTIVYSEIHRVTTAASGSVTVILGNGTEKNGNFTSIDWNDDKYFMKVEIETAPGKGYNEIGTIQILSVPYTMPSGSSKKGKDLQEEKLFISRKYVGKFMDFRQTGPNDYNGPNIIWIKTTMNNTYGKISAFGKKCEFAVGDNLYIKRSYYSPGGVFGYWEYRIENDSSVYYRVSDYQYDQKVLVESWFK